MNLAVNELAKFEDDVETWMKENVPSNPDFLLPLTFLEVGSTQQLDFLRTWQQKIWKAGFLGMHWPTKYGGQGVSPKYQEIVDRLLVKYNAPIIFNSIGLNWTGPLLLDIGNEAEKVRFLKRILSAEDIWCQGFSEPEHGSDLGSVNTRAVRDGDDYVLNGSKIWTTLGNYADHMILLAKTDPRASRKYDGLSFFLSPMKISGIEVRPIRKLTGEFGFNEVIFFDARIPASSLLGTEGDGWHVAMKTLEYERGVMAGQASGHAMLSVDLNDLIESLSEFERDGLPSLKDPLLRDQLVGIAIEAQANAVSDRRSNIGPLTNDYPMGIALSHKYRHTELARRLKQIGATMQGADSSLFMEDKASHRGGFWQRAYFANFGTTIGGGTTQIQANIIAEHVLGLPKS